MCHPDGADQKSHHFHRECIVDMAGALYCPHCGNTSDLREVSVPDGGGGGGAAAGARRKIPKSMILSGVVKLPKSLLGKLLGCSPEAELEAKAGPGTELERGREGEKDEGQRQIEVNDSEQPGPR